MANDNNSWQEAVIGMGIFNIIALMLVLYLLFVTVVIGAICLLLYGAALWGSRPLVNFVRTHDDDVTAKLAFTFFGTVVATTVVALFLGLAGTDWLHGYRTEFLDRSLAIDLILVQTTASVALALIVSRLSSFLRKHGLLDCERRLLRTVFWRAMLFGVAVFVAILALVWGRISLLLIVFWMLGGLAPLLWVTAKTWPDLQSA